MNTTSMVQDIRDAALYPQTTERFTVKTGLGTTFSCKNTPEAIEALIKKVAKPKKRGGPIYQNMKPRSGPTAKGTLTAMLLEQDNANALAFAEMTDQFLFFARDKTPYNLALLTDHERLSDSRFAIAKKRNLGDGVIWVIYHIATGHNSLQGDYKSKCDISGKKALIEKFNTFDDGIIQKVLSKLTEKDFNFQEETKAKLNDAN